MPSGNSTKPLIVIVGPTGVGKTEISLALAERWNAEIVSADSRLLYRGMDIGTAKPTPEERARVRHHLVDVAEPNQVWSLAKYQREAYAAIEDIHQRGTIPLLVGGTGQYVRAVVEGWRIPEVKPDQKLRLILEKWAEEIGSSQIHNRLASLDPMAAQAIDPPNVRRSIRALEVIFRTGRLFSSQKKKLGPRYRTLILGVNRPRPDLYARIDARIQDMLAAGFIDEVRLLLEKDYPPDLPAFSAIGYRQIIDYLSGRISLEEAVCLIKRSTRQYVRRQANWFKPQDARIHWFQVGPKTVDEMEAMIKNHVMAD